MKKALCVILAAALLVGGFLLGRATAPGVESTTFYATIESISGDHIVVSGLEVNDINHRGDFQFDLDGAELRWRYTGISAEDLDVGDTIAITYTGQVAEISPAIIRTVLKIELLDDEK